MGVYAPTARMPANCYRCEFEEMEVECPCTIGADLASNWRTSRHPQCPLIEVKEPHGDLIDRDKLKWLKYVTGEDGTIIGEYVSIPPAWIDHAPAVIEAEGEQ